jgi:cell division protein FtsB
MARADRPSSSDGQVAASKRRSRLILLGAVVLSAAVMLAWFPAGSLLQQRANLASANEQLHQLHQQDSALTQERQNLSNSSEIARIAREQYQLVNSGQQAYQVLPPAGSTQGAGSDATDPGSQGPVAPSGSAELPSGGVTTTVPAKGSGQSSTNSSPSTLSRMLQALEFWR